MFVLLWLSISFVIQSEVSSSTAPTRSTSEKTETSAISFKINQLGSNTTDPNNLTNNMNEDMSWFHKNVNDNNNEALTKDNEKTRFILTIYYILSGGITWFVFTIICCANTKRCSIRNEWEEQSFCGLMKFFMRLINRYNVFGAKLRHCLFGGCLCRLGCDWYNNIYEYTICDCNPQRFRDDRCFLDRMFCCWKMKYIKKSHSSCEDRCTDQESITFSSSSLSQSNCEHIAMRHNESQRIEDVEIQQENYAGNYAFSRPHIRFKCDWARRTWKYLFCMCSNGEHILNENIEDDFHEEPKLCHCFVCQNATEWDESRLTNDPLHVERQPNSCFCCCPPDDSSCSQCSDDDIDFEDALENDTYACKKCGKVRTYDEQNERIATIEQHVNGLNLRSNENNILLEANDNGNNSNNNNNTVGGNQENHSTGQVPRFGSSVDWELVSQSDEKIGSAKDKSSCGTLCRKIFCNCVQCRCNFQGRLNRKPCQFFLCNYGRRGSLKHAMGRKSNKEWQCCKCRKGHTELDVYLSSSEEYTTACDSLTKPVKNKLRCKWDCHCYCFKKHCKCIACNLQNEQHWENERKGKQQQFKKEGNYNCICCKCISYPQQRKESSLNRVSSGKGYIVTHSSSGFANSSQPPSNMLHHADMTTKTKTLISDTVCQAPQKYTPTTPPFTDVPAYVKVSKEDLKLKYLLGEDLQEDNTLTNKEKTKGDVLDFRPNPRSSGYSGYFTKTSSNTTEHSRKYNEESVVNVEEQSEKQEEGKTKRTFDPVKHNFDPVVYEAQRERNQAGKNLEEYFRDKSEHKKK